MEYSWTYAECDYCDFWVRMHCLHGHMPHLHCLNWTGQEFQRGTIVDQSRCGHVDLEYLVRCCVLVCHLALICSLFWDVLLCSSVSPSFHWLLVLSCEICTILTCFMGYNFTHAQTVALVIRDGNSMQLNTSIDGLQDTQNVGFGGGGSCWLVLSRTANCRFITLEPLHYL